MTAAEKLINKFQGAVRLAEEIGVHRTTPHHWVKRGGYIPPEHHAKILERARALNIHVGPADLVNV